jgi:hypothetical protein
VGPRLAFSGTVLLPFSTDLIETTQWDQEMRLLADRHYSRRTVGAKQFLYAGRKLVIRNAEGTVLFAWIYPIRFLKWRN